MTKSKLKEYFLGIIMLLIGIVTFCSMLSITISDIRKAVSWSEVQAVIEDIRVTDKRTMKHKGTIDYDVYVSYIYNDRNYDSMLDTYRDSMREGREIKIYVNPDNPSEVMLMPSFSTIIGSVIFGLLFTFAGILILKDTSKNSKSKSEDDVINMLK